MKFEHDFAQEAQGAGFVDDEIGTPPKNRLHRHPLSRNVSAVTKR